MDLLRSSLSAMNGEIRRNSDREASRIWGGICNVINAGSERLVNGEDEEGNDCEGMRAAGIR